MTFLKKLGQYILQAAGVFTGFAPLVQAALPNAGGLIQTISKDLSQIAELVVTAESFGQANNIPGPQRATYIADAVVQVLLQSTVLAGKKIANPILLKQAGETIASGVAMALNAVHEDVVGDVTKNVT